MTSCNFRLTRDRVDVVTDTLSHDNDGKPVRFFAKAVAVNHLEIVLAGRGHNGGVMALWNAMLGGKVWTIDEMGSEGLGVIQEVAKSDVWKDCDAACERLKPGFSAASTYAFGWSEARGRFIGWEFIGGKQVKPVEDRLAISPPVLLKRGMTWVEIALLQQETEPHWIGGHVIACAMTRKDGRTTIASSVLGRLPRYDEDLEAIRARPA